MKKSIIIIMLWLSAMTFAGNCGGAAVGDTASAASGSGSSGQTANNGTGGSTDGGTGTGGTTDTTAPNAPSTPVLDASDDSGKNNWDKLTNVKTGLTIKGTAETDSSVQLYNNGTVIGMPGMATSGSWSIDIDIPTDGTYNITATATDAAGNASPASAALSLTIDATAPLAANLPDLYSFGTYHDSGISNTDDITNNVSPRIDITSAETGRYYFFVDGVNGGTFQTSTLYYPAALSDGTHTITVAVADDAGNLSAQSPALNLTIDTTAPFAPTVPDLDIADDTGSDLTDNITKFTSLLTFSGTTEIGSTIKLYQDGGLKTNEMATTLGNYSIDISLSGGAVYAISAVATDLAGNSSADSGALNVTVDNTVPTAPSMPDLAASDDTGTSSTDNITNATLTMPFITFSGTADTGSLVQLYKSGAPVGFPIAANATTGVWTIMVDPVDLPDGTYNITAKATDLAGNLSSVSNLVSVTFDTSVPAATSLPDLAAVDDTGSNSTDNNTKNISALTISGISETNSSIQLYIDSVATGAPVTSTAGAWSIDISLAENITSYSVTAIATDVAGNVGVASSILSITVDTTAPAAPTTPDLNVADDSGSSNSDNITKNTTALTFDGSTDIGSTLQLYSNSIAIGTPGSETAGTYSIDISLAGGSTYAITAKATDIAGNISAASSGLNVTIDATIPVAPSLPDLAGTDDTGSSNIDNITRATAISPNITFNGTAEANSSVQLYIGGVASGTPVTVTAGAWSILVPSTSFPDGVYSITTKATDVAGNLGLVSATLNVTFDTSSPGATSLPDLAAADDTGSSSTDNITKNISALTISGTAEANSKVQLYVDTVATGALLTATAGAWSIDISLSGGVTYSVTAISTDIAGNVSPASSALSITVDTAAPTIIAAETMDSNGNGNIDGYKITFSKSVNDSTFPGYVANGVGNAQTAWLLAGSNGLKLAHGTASPVADVISDNIIYLKFIENALPDTGNKPDLTTTVSPALTDTSGNAITQQFTASVTEADRAKPVVLSAQSTSETGVKVLFSEIVSAATAEITANYISALALNTASMELGASLDDDVVLLGTSTQTGGVNNYVISANAVQDLAVNTITSPYNSAGFSGFASNLVLKATGGDMQITLSWTPPTGMTSYNIYWSTTRGVTTATGTKITSVTSPYIHSGLANGTSYYYIVTGVNGTNESMPSNEVKGTAVLYQNQFYQINPNLSSPRYFPTATLLTDGKVLVAGGSNGPIYASSAEIYDPTTKTFSAVGNMTTPRFNQKAVLLANGKVLIVGGYNGSGWLSSVELFDPATNTFSVVGNMQVARNFPTTSLLTNGSVLITGDSASVTADLYDPVTNTLSAAGNMNTTRYRHTATTLSDGRVLITGGSAGNYLSSTEIYDPATNTFSTAGTMNIGRSSHHALLLGNGKVLVAGGYNLSSYISNAEIYDPAADSFTNVGSMLTERANAAATLLSNGKVLISGGTNNFSTGLTTADLFDPATNTFSYVSLGQTRSGHTATLLLDNTVLIAGGNGLSSTAIFDPATNLLNSGAGSFAQGIDQTSTLLNDGRVLCTMIGLTSAIYDPLTNLYSPVNNLTTNRSKHTATLLLNGKVLIAGGTDSTAELFDPATNSFSATGSMASVRWGHTATLLNSGKVLITGGAGLATAEVFDPASNTFSSAGSMPSTLFYHTATLATSGKVVIISGQNGGLYSASILLYDPQTNAFSIVNSITSQRSHHTATLLNDGKILVTGGSANSTVYSSSFLYDPIANTLTNTGIMTTPRMYHTATLLADGKVLVVGGRSTTSYIGLASAEIFDPSTNNYSATTSAPLVRDGNGNYSHNAVMMDNGSVLITGGDSTSFDLFQ